MTVLVHSELGYPGVADPINRDGHFLIAKLLELLTICAQFKTPPRRSVLRLGYRFLEEITDVLIRVIGGSLRDRDLHDVAERTVHVAHVYDIADNGHFARKDGLSFATLLRVVGNQVDVGPFVLLTGLSQAALI